MPVELPHTRIDAARPETWTYSWHDVIAAENMDAMPKPSGIRATYVSDQFLERSGVVGLLWPYKRRR